MEAFSPDGKLQNTSAASITFTTSWTKYIRMTQITQTLLVWPALHWSPALSWRFQILISSLRNRIDVFLWYWEGKKHPLNTLYPSKLWRESCNLIMIPVSSLIVPDIKFDIFPFSFFLFIWNPTGNILERSQQWQVDRRGRVREVWRNVGDVVMM